MTASVPAWRQNNVFLPTCTNSSVPMVSQERPHVSAIFRVHPAQMWPRCGLDGSRPRGGIRFRGRCYMLLVITPLPSGLGRVTVQYVPVLLFPSVPGEQAQRRSLHVYSGDCLFMKITFSHCESNAHAPFYLSFSLSFFLSFFPQFWHISPLDGLNA